MLSKRKAVAALGIDMAEDEDGRVAKKKKSSTVIGESPEATTKEGLKVLAAIQEERDKRNRLIATSFLTLPDKGQEADYYKIIKLPIALDTIEVKLNRHEYPTLTTLESDFRRMVSNAKSYNERQSDIFSDAEKIRKKVVKLMQDVNPAYKYPDYKGFPTAIESQDEGIKNDDGDVEDDGETGSEEVTEQLRRRGRSSLAARASSAAATSDIRRASSTPAVQAAEGAGESFEGNTFQQAQEKIMTEMIDLKDEDGELISAPFINLPSRTMRDYYSLIRKPVCLKGVQKMVRGIRGRDKPTGVTLFRSWQSFEDEMSYIWINARDYNEPGSSIPKMADQLEAYFKRRIAEAKTLVVEPQKKVKLKVHEPEPPVKIHLRFNHKSNGGAGSMTVDSEALKRQQDLVNAGANGQGTSNANTVQSRAPQGNPFGRSSAVTASMQVPPLRDMSQELQRSLSAEQGSGVKRETPLGQSPALGSAQPSQEANGLIGTTQNTNHLNSVMAPPSSTTPRLQSGSPHPQLNSLQNNGSSSYHNAAVAPVDSRWRQRGKDTSDALLSNLSIATHPGLKIDHHFHLDIPPSSTLTQQSITINLPSTHYYLRIIPTLSPNVVQRPSRLFVTAGHQRLNPIPQRPEESDSRRPVYEARITPGVNRIEIEIVAGALRGTPKIGSGNEIELEKITVFANVRSV